MGFQQRRTTHAGWPAAAPVIPESPELYAPQPPASGDVQFAHARQRRAQAASVAALCFTALVLTPELIASTHDTNAVIEAAQAQSRALTQYQAIAAPVFVPAVVVPAPELTPPVYPRWFDRRPARAAYQRGFAWHPVTPAAVLSGDVVWTGPNSGAWNFVDGPLPFTTPGVYTLTFSQTFTLRVTGAAGGGGGARGLAGSVSNSKGGGGGGAGATDAVGELVTVTAGPSYTVTVGTAGVGTSPESDGGLTDFTLGATVYLRLTGGSKGTIILGGAGGTVSTGAHAVAGQSGGFGGDESSPADPNSGSGSSTGAGGGGGGGYAGDAGANGGAGRDQIGGGGGGPNNDGNAASGMGGLSGSGTAGGGGGGGGGILLSGTTYGGGGGGGSGGRTSAGNGGLGGPGVLVLAIAVPDGRQTADNGQAYPERAWQYQQTAAPVYFELTVPPINEPPIGPSDGPASTIEGVSVGRPKVVQYQAIAAPVLVRTPLTIVPSTVYPSRLVRRATPTSQQLATVLPPLQPLPTGVAALAPQSFEPRPAWAASMLAFAWAPSTPADYPLGSAQATYPRWFPLRSARAAYMPAFAWGTVTPPTYPIGSATAVYPNRLTRLQYRTSDQLATVGSPDTPPSLIPPDFSAYPVYPNRLEGRPARAAYQQALGWNSDTSLTYPLGSAIAIYPRWFPRPAMLASQQQAVAWNSTTPLLLGAPPVYPARTLGRAARAAYQQALAWSPVTPETRPDFTAPSDSGAILPDRAWQYQQISAPVAFEPTPEPPPEGAIVGGVIEAAQASDRALTQYQATAGPVYVRSIGPGDWTPIAPSYFSRKPWLTAAQQQSYAAPLVVPDVTSAPTPALTPAVYPSRLTRLHALPQHLATAQPVVVIPNEPVPELVEAVFPDRLDRARAPQHQAVAWAPVVVESYPVGSATVIAPRWFPRREARAAYLQALGWSTFTPPDVTPGEFFFTSVYPRRLDRAPRMLPGYRAAPVYITDVTDPPPTLLPPPVYPRRLDRRVGRPGTIPSRAVLPILPPDELPPPSHVCVTAPPTAGCWPPDDETPPSVKPIGRAGRQRP